MRPRDILAANLRAMMLSCPELGTLPKITARSGVSNGTLDRIRRAAVSTRIDELENLAGAFGIEAWELLRPHGPGDPSPLGLMLASHLDRCALDDEMHRAAFAAAMATIDSLVDATPGSPPAPALDPEATPAPVPATEKRGGSSR
jgi:hypothetical protein